jgi:hypothetical protein
VTSLRLPPVRVAAATTSRGSRSRPA